MFLKRAGWSLWRHKFRNILVLLVFSAILAVTLTSFMIYAGTSYQVEVTQKAVANAVTLTGNSMAGLLPNGFINVEWSAADLFVRGPHVENYNIVMQNVQMDSPDLMPGGLSEEDEALYHEYRERLSKFDGDYLNFLNQWSDACMTYSNPYTAERLGKGDFEYRWEMQWDDELGVIMYDIYDGELSPEENEQFLADYNLMQSGILDGKLVPKGFSFTAISDSELYDSFSSGGYSLVEGRHFKSQEEDQDYVIISRALAERNGLQVGDTIELGFTPGVKSMATFYKDEPWELEILGLFDPPQNNILEEVGYQDAAVNFMFVPYQAAMNYLRRLYNNDTLLWFPNINRATVYLDSAESIEEFVADAHDKFRLIELDPESGMPAGESLVDVLGEGAFGVGDKDVVDAKLMEYVRGANELAPTYTLTVDRDWYDMVAMPMESLNSLSLFMGIGLLAGAFVALLLVCVFNVRGRKKEVGILLAMGETRLKIFTQIFIEQALPLVLAAAIGFAAGVPLASALGNTLLHSRATEVNAAYEQDKREFLQEQLGENSYDLEMSTMTRSAANVASPVEMQFDLDTAMAWGYFALAFCMLFMTVLIQMVFLLRLSPAKILTRRN